MHTWTDPAQATLISFSIFTGIISFCVPVSTKVDRLGPVPESALFAPLGLESAQF